MLKFVSYLLHSVSKPSSYFWRFFSKASANYLALPFLIPLLRMSLSKPSATYKSSGPRPFRLLTSGNCGNWSDLGSVFAAVSAS